MEKVFLKNKWSRHPPIDLVELLMDEVSKLPYVQLRQVRNGYLLFYDNEDLILPLFQPESIEKFDEAGLIPQLPYDEIKKRSIFIKNGVPEHTLEMEPADLKASINATTDFPIYATHVFKSRIGLAIMKITFLLQRCVLECLENGIKLCSMSFPKEHIEVDKRTFITLCSRCCSVSHTRKDCTKPFSFQRCGNCSEVGHDFKNCPPGTPYKCFTCAEDHPVLSPQCRYNKDMHEGRLPSFGLSVGKETKLQITMKFIQGKEHGKDDKGNKSFGSKMGRDIGNEEEINKQVEHREREHDDCFHDKISNPKTKALYDALHVKEFTHDHQDIDIDHEESKACEIDTRLISISGTTKKLVDNNRSRKKRPTLLRKENMEKQRDETICERRENKNKRSFKSQNNTEFFCPKHYFYEDPSLNEVKFYMDNHSTNKRKAYHIDQVYYKDPAFTGFQTIYANSSEEEHIIDPEQQNVFEYPAEMFYLELSPEGSVMVKVREGEEAYPTPPPVVTLTPSALPQEQGPRGPLVMGPSPASSLSASGPESPTSSVNSAGETVAGEDRPNSGSYHRHPRGGGGGCHPHHQRHNSRRQSPTYRYIHPYNNNNNNTTNGYQNGSGGGSGYYNNHYHHNGGYYHNQNGSQHSHYSNHHYHHHGGRYHEAPGGYYHYKGGGYNEGYNDYHYNGHNTPRGRHKQHSGCREEDWSREGIRGGRGRGRYKSASPVRGPRPGSTASAHSSSGHSRGASPRPSRPCSRPNMHPPPPPPTSKDPAEATEGQVTVEVGSSGGLVGVLEDGLLLGVGTGEEGQHVVHLHINPGTTVNFTTEEGVVQRISGPASVRMVSNNPSPPIALPVQVPPGHVVQQIVDEQGTLRHVILSAQPMPMPMCPYGPNTGQGPPFYAPPPPGPPHQGYVPPYQPPPQYSPVMSPPLTQPSPPPHNFQKSDRHLRQYEKVRQKYYQRNQPPPPPHQHHNKSGTSSLQSTPPASPKKESVAKNCEQESTIEDGEDSCNNLLAALSQIQSPKVSSLTAYEATLNWVCPELNGHSEEISAGEIKYEVFLNGNLHTTLTATQCILHNLKPAHDYNVSLVCCYGSIRGEGTPSIDFRTLSSIPDPPQQPRLFGKTKTSLNYKWGTVKDNGCRVKEFVLELSVGNSGDWEEVYRGRSKQHQINKLQANTTYRVRLSAVNDHGRSPYSQETISSTAGVVPVQPAPPMLESASVASVVIRWVQRSHEERFTLQMEDSCTGYGFQVVYDGPDTRFACEGLQRNLDYKFRLRAHNEEGSSPYSDITCYRTLPDRPHPPLPPKIKGRTKSNSLFLVWNPPLDHGGSPVTSYKLELDSGRGFIQVYLGDACEYECNDLNPGSNYRVRITCESGGGTSDSSDVVTLTTEAICPGKCHPPRLNGKPKACTLQLKWDQPDYEGGAPVAEYHVDLMSPDNERRQVYCGRELECTVASLLPGRPYIFLVRAVNRIGTSVWSEPLEVVSGAGPPDTVHAPHMACRGPQTVQVTWDQPINNGAAVDQYIVQVAEVCSPHCESSESSSTCGDMEPELTFTTGYTGPQTTAEVRALSAATTYAFRVCASNSAGCGGWSTHSSVTTPAAPPAPVAYVSSSPSATQVTLLWGEPASHGDPITHYIIEYADKAITTPGCETEYTVPDLHPETVYKMRIQAVNTVGSGGFSAYHKVTTRPLPPPPPTIELIRASYNSLRLKWGDSKSSDLTYSLQMEFNNPHNDTMEFYEVYNGNSHNYKVSKLEENSTYRLRICAWNEAGTGANSSEVEMCTTKAPPQPLKAPRVNETSEGYSIEWCGARCPGDDVIMYRLQVLQAGKDNDYSLAYSGCETSYLMSDLEPSSGYYVRVCGVRSCSDGETMVGAYSSPTLFNTPKPAPAQPKTMDVSTTQESGLSWSQLSDSQKAMVILVLFSGLCLLGAVGLQHFLAQDEAWQR